MSLQKLLLQIEFQLERNLHEEIQLFQLQVAAIELQVLCKMAHKIVVGLYLSEQVF